MADFKPGDKVKHRVGRSASIPATFVSYDEGWCLVEWDTVRTRSTVRPSELTPADPGPDAQTALVSAIIRAYSTTRSSLTTAEAHVLSKPAVKDAFAKYLRANPPQPELTVEALKAAMIGVGLGRATAEEARALHAALTERKP